MVKTRVSKLFSLSVLTRNRKLHNLLECKTLSLVSVVPRFLTGSHGHGGRKVVELPTIETKNTLDIHLCISDISLHPRIGGSSIHSGGFPFTTIIIVLYCIS